MSKRFAFLCGFIGILIILREARREDHFPDSDYNNPAWFTIHRNS